MSLNLVFDVMHATSLNIFKNYNLELFNTIKLCECTKDVKEIYDVVEKEHPHVFYICSYCYNKRTTRTTV